VVSTDLALAHSLIESFPVIYSYIFSLFRKLSVIGITAHSGVMEALFQGESSVNRETTLHLCMVVRASSDLRCCSTKTC